MSTPIETYNGFPRLSLQERERRFAAVRDRMKQRSIDCVVIRSDSSKWDAGSAEGRYLSHIGGNGEDGYVIFDIKEEPVFIIWGPDHISNWLEIQGWTKDIRPMVPSAADAIVKRIKELGREKGTIGLVGRLGSRLWRGEGRWPQGNHQILQRELPQAKFVDFDEELWAIMAIKSDEEIYCIERAMQIIEQALEGLYESARVGTRIPEVVGRVYGSILSAGSDSSIQVLFAAGERTPRVAGRIFPDRRLERGDMIINEITAKYCGYWAQVHAPISVGEPPRPEFQRVFEAAFAALQAGISALKPGITTMQLAQAVQKPVLEMGYDVNAMPLFKGMGTTIAEFPYSPTGVGLDATGKARSFEIQPGQVILFEPAAYDEKLKVGIHIGEQVVVTQDGCHRIGKRKLELKVT
jgi:Xaa-Pro aminopeptidase